MVSFMTTITIFIHKTADLGIMFSQLTSEANTFPQISFKQGDLLTGI